MSTLLSLKWSKKAVHFVPGAPGIGFAEAAASPAAPKSFHSVPLILPSTGTKRHFTSGKRTHIFIKYSSLLVKVWFFGVNCDFSSLEWKNIVHDFWNDSNFRNFFQCISYGKLENKMWQLILNLISLKYLNNYQLINQNGIDW